MSEIFPVIARNEFKIVFQRLPYWAPGFVGSVVGLVGQVSVCCDWARWQVLDQQLLSQCLSQ